MSDTEAGGPAFPNGDVNLSGEQRCLSIRDYFAGQALSGLTGSLEFVTPGSMKMRANAEWCYAWADAMLKARKR